MRWIVLVVAFVTSALPAAAAPSAEDGWLTALGERVAADAAAGKPLVVEVHVPLCDRSIIPCGNAKLGDGDNPETNLYWATTPGFGRWFARRGAGWKRALATTTSTGDRDILALHVYRKTVATPAAWRRRGAPARLAIAIVVRAWRGTAIDRALAAYAEDLSQTTARAVTLDDGTALAAGGAAHLVAWVGHNRLMDVDAFTWPTPASTPKGAIAIACHTAAYMEDRVPAATRVPLLMTRDFLFANAAPLEATVLAFAAGGSYAAIRRAAAAAYAGVQQRELRRVQGAFTNPADRRWKHQRPAARPAP